MIIAVADRRISKQDGSYDSSRRKLFSIPHLNGAISYFGLATVYPRGHPEYLSNWLPNFINHQSNVSCLKDFAELLLANLNSIVPPSILKDRASGFHICGYNESGYPDFWFLSNIGSLQEFRYGNLSSQYSPPGSHFLDRDAREKFNWDGSDPLTARNGAMTYRNGDFRAHAMAWDLLDEIYRRLIYFPDFKSPRTPEEYSEYVKFKFEMLAYIYKKRAMKKIIARPIDVLVLKSDH